ncbi:O-antigen ligase [Salinisphaera sp. Q1T1-3]|uniref:O-antigen ligase family protein n=1 Tax=Salinisphaera sp. Q1T1-3 TaxID=2321229 RepID=UPI000E71E77D|nr:O-antigen ligase family protein [Salinisphaera sp. Q1T1-3]RJS94993.1 O-antigen ligase family protein [Salinisphaera sp. Q1T1-3]
MIERSSVSQAIAFIFHIWAKIKKNTNVFYAWLLIPFFPALSFDECRIALTLAVCLTALSAVEVSPLLRTSKATVILSCALALGLVSAVNAERPYWGVLETTFFGLLFLSIYRIAYSENRAKRAAFRVYPLLVFTSVLVTVYIAVITIFIAYFQGESVDKSQLTANFWNIRLFNQYQTWSLPLITTTLVISPPSSKISTWIWQSFILILGGFFWSLLWISGGRGTLYATVAVSIFVCLFYGRIGRRYAFRTLSLAAIGFLFARLMFGWNEVTNTHLESTELSGRSQLWILAWQSIKASPLIGIGPMQFATYNTGVAANPHNTPLQLAAEWGIPATSVFLGVAGYLGFGWLRFSKRAVEGSYSKDFPADVQNIIVGITASLGAAGIHSLVSGLLVMPISTAMFVIITGCAGLIYRTYNTPNVGPIREPAKPLQIHFSRVVIIASIIYVAGFTSVGFFEKFSKNTVKSPTQARNSYEPRFWSDGTLTK